MDRRLAVVVPLLACSFVVAGEIIVIQPAGNESRSERNAARASERARQQTGRPAGPIVVEDGVVQQGSNATRSSRDAQEYLGPANTTGGGDGNTTIILRSAPPTDSERARQKAASYVQTPNPSALNRNCGDVALTIGTVGDKTVGDRSVTVNERGNSAVNVNCKR